MPGIDPQLITHKLNVDSLKKPIKQKRKEIFASKRQEAIKQEVGKTIGSRVYRGNTISRVASQPSNGQKGQWKMEDVCGFHGS